MEAEDENDEGPAEFADDSYIKEHNGKYYINFVHWELEEVEVEK